MTDQKCPNCGEPGRPRQHWIGRDSSITEDGQYGCFTTNANGVDAPPPKR